MADLIDPSELDRHAKKVPEWEIDGDAITRTFEFDEFSEAIDFVNSVAEIAEEAHHHPDIDIRFNTVVLTLTTHDLGGLTKADFEVAGRIDNLVD
jgi:4a-hydroxytetrahydrobiopterin dehydratase